MAEQHPDLLAQLIAHAASRPDAPALRDDVATLTWRELLESVKRTGAALSALGVVPGDRVALRLSNSAAFVTAALACLWSGSAFVPVSVEDPIERVRWVLEDCRPSVVIVADGAVIDGSPVRNVAVSELAGESTGEDQPCLSQGRDAYLIYTSGTTGRPKGVRISVEALSWAAAVSGRAFGLSEATRSLSVSAFHFDGSYATLFTTLYAGGCLVIPDREQILFGRRFFSAVLEEGITHTSFSPTYLRLLLKSRRFSDLKAGELLTLALGGEELTGQDLEQVWAVLPGLRIFNIYGPTETTIQVTSFEVSKSSAATGDVCLGGPHDGVQFYVVDGVGDRDLGGAKRGELYIGGRQLMTGYWGDDLLTRRVLRTDVVPGQTVYKTGDIVERDQKGVYRYIGRADDVVKRRGVRVSLGEVARVLGHVDGVEAAVVLPVDDGGALAVAAFVQTPLESSGPILQAARKQLPATMMPDMVFVLRVFPMTSSGKVDRASLLSDSGCSGWT
jgi:D-alanine--poly(phosphoribitol) ligase subunit 1